MNSNYASKQNAWKSSQKVLGKNAVEVGSLPALKATAENIDVEMGQLEVAMQGQLSTGTGDTKDKDALKVKLAAEAAVVAGAVAAYALEIDNNTLHHSVDYTESKMVHMKDGLLNSVCQDIFDAAAGNIASLGDYGISQTKLDAFSHDMTKYSSLLGIGKSKKSAAHASTMSIADRVSEITMLFEKADLLMLQFKTTNPDFYNTWTASRVIQHTGHHKIVLKGKVKSKKTGSIVNKALLKIEETGNAVNSSSHGGYSFKSVPSGNYTMTVTKQGYTTTTVNVTIDENKTTVLDIEI